MKNDALKELQMISSQMQSSSHNRVRPEDVEEAKEAAARLAKDRDSMNTHPRREAITSEIRVQEEKLKDIASNVEKDTKVRDQLRAKSDEQNEIDMVSFVLLSVAITLVLLCTFSHHHIFSIFPFRSLSDFHTSIVGEASQSRV